MIEVTIALRVATIDSTPFSVGSVQLGGFYIGITPLFKAFIREKLDLIAVVGILVCRVDDRLRQGKALLAQHNVTVKQPVEDGALRLRLAELRFKGFILFPFLKCLSKGTISTRPLVNSVMSLMTGR